MVDCCPHHPGPPSEEFPKPPEVGDEDSVVVGGSVLTKELSKSGYSSVSTAQVAPRDRSLLVHVAVVFDANSTLFVNIRRPTRLAVSGGTIDLIDFDQFPTWAGGDAASPPVQQRW